MASSVQEVLSEQLLKAAAVVEEQLDHQMERMDHLGEDDLEAIRRRRMQEIKKKQLEKQVLIYNRNDQDNRRFERCSNRYQTSPRCA